MSQEIRETICIFWAIRKRAAVLKHMVEQQTATAERASSFLYGSYNSLRFVLGGPYEEKCVFQVYALREA